MSGRRHALTDKQWNEIKDLIPILKGPGRPAKDHRLMLDGMIWVLKTGLAWRDLPGHYFGPWKTVYERFREWSQTGLWEKILLKLQADFEREGKIDWKLFSIDGSSVRAHKSAAGAKKTLLARGSLQTMPWGGVEVDSAPKSTLSAMAKGARSRRK